jgi:hypothetical protein
MARSGGRPRGGSKLVAMPTTENDAQHGLWTREQIERMDAEFCCALERAINDGREHAPMSIVAER